jgi:putative membrane protein
MRMRAHLLILVFAGVLAAGSAGCGKSGVQAAREPDLTPQQILSIDDQKFLDDAEKAEIKQNTLADLALQRSKGPEIQGFATKVSNDMRLALSELTDLRKAKHLAEPADLAAEVHSHEAFRLDHASDSAVDHEFVSLMAAEGQDIVRIFDSAANTAADPDVRNYASRALPSLRANYDKASELEKKLTPKPAQ